MATTIDSLQIDIQSSSSNAAKGIRELSTALKSLQKNGDVSTAISNLNQLSGALNGVISAQHGANKISALAYALGKLKKIGSLSSLTDSLNKLPAALSGLNNINIDGFSEKIARVSEAMRPLANVKASGLSSAVNALGKLGTVAKSLDDDAIDDFADKIARLVSKLEPLKDKLAALQFVLRNVGTSARNAGGEINAAGHNFFTFSQNAETVIQTLVQIGRALAQVVKQAIEWDGIAARFGRGFGPQAQETYEWIQRLNEEMGINVQQFMQYSSVYATMLTGFGVAVEDAGKMALGYSELTYDIWAGYNDIYKNFEDAAEAVKSAIAGEVEPIRRAGFTIVEATLKQTAANHGLSISLETATEAQKSYLRYLTLVDQAHSQNLVGTYAKEMNTAEGLVRTFTQQLKSLAQAFGSLFLPILVKVLPYLQAFVELLTDAVRAVAGFFGIEIQAVDFSGYVSGIGGAADATDGFGNSAANAAKAAKALKNATTGIDELNIISPPAQSAGSAGAGAGGAGFDGLPIDSLWDESIFDGIQSQVDELKEKVKKLLPWVAAVSAGFAGWKIVGIIKAIGELKGKLGKLGIVPAISGWFSKLGGTKMGGIASKIFNGLKAAISGLSFKTIVTTLGRGLLTAVKAIPVWGWIAAAVIALLAGAIKLGMSDKDFTPIGEKIGEFLGTSIRKTFEAGAALGRKIKEGLKNAFNWVMETFEFDSVWDLISTIFNPAKWITKIAPKILAIGAEVLPGLWKGVMSWWENLKSNISEFIDGFVSGFMKGLGFEGEGKDSKTFKEIGGNLVKGIIDGIKGKATELWSELSTWATGIIDKVKSLFGIHSPSTEFKSIGVNCVAGLVQPFSVDALTKPIRNMWNNAKAWWNDKKGAMATYTPSIGNITNKVSSAWNSARTWWNTKKSALSTYTPSIGSISSKLSSAWSAAKKWWGSKGSMSFTPTIGSITNALKNAWNSAKKWWNSNVKLSIPSLSLKVTYSNASGWKKAVANALDLPGWPSLKFAANGGMFDMGSLIWAGERGAEIVANANGGKTGVMNVEQMYQAVYDATYAAMMAAMAANSGGEQAVNVYLDGKQITSSVESRQKERGKTLMGTQVYSY